MRSTGTHCLPCFTRTGAALTVRSICPDGKATAVDVSDVASSIRTLPPQRRAVISAADSSAAATRR